MREIRTPVSVGSLDGGPSNSERGWSLKPGRDANSVSVRTTFRQHLDKRHQAFFRFFCGYLFTSDWIVRYMVENSLGRLWIEGHPNDTLKANWQYYLDEAEQELDVTSQLKKIRAEYIDLNPEEIKVIDPCLGSGHILVYAFDVLMQIYESCGYSARDAASLIVEKNLYGLDVDDRAYQLAYFAVMMKGRKYDSIGCRVKSITNLSTNLPNVLRPERRSRYY